MNPPVSNLLINITPQSIILYYICLKSIVYLSSIIKIYNLKAIIYYLFYTKKNKKNNNNTNKQTKQNKQTNKNTKIQKCNVMHSYIVMICSVWAP
jgi:hypothetical protein